MEKLLAAYKIGDLQRILQLDKLLKQNGKTLDDIENYLKYVEKNPPKEALKLTNQLCPICSNNMLIYPVNDSKCRQVGGNYKSQWYCSSCGESILSERSVKEELENGNK